MNTPDRQSDSTMDLRLSGPAPHNTRPDEAPTADFGRELPYSEPGGFAASREGAEPDCPVAGDPPEFLGTERFRLEEKLGIGGMATVWRAYDAEWHRHVALKAVACHEVQQLDRLEHEYASLSQLSHRNIVTAHEFYRSASYSFFTMELVEGFDWLLHVRFGPPSGQEHTTDPPRTDDRARSRALHCPRQFDRLRRTLAQLVDALEYLHRQGAVHCDVKPSNVLVTPEGRVVLIDFGLFSTFGSRERLSQTDIRMAGTAAYMAPELSEFIEPDPALDWYSVGIMLFEALTGHLPFRGTFEDVMAAKRTGKPPSVQDRAGDFPEDLAELCRRLMHADPKRRPRGDEIRRVLRTARGYSRSKPPSLN